MNRDIKLSLYAVGAIAATAWTGAEQAEATVIPSSGFTFGLDSTNDVDLNLDGTADFQITQISLTKRIQLIKSGPPFSGNNYVTAGDVDPAALSAGTSISNSSTFDITSPSVIADGPNSGVGHFAIDDIVGNTQYIGVSFNSDGHGPTPLYGWIGIDITDAVNVTGSVTGFAYEDSGGPIDAGATPEPAGLALLALGAPFLLKRRNRA